MALSYGFYNAINHDRTYDAVQISSIFDGIIEDGVFATILDASGHRIEKHFQVLPGEVREDGRLSVKIDIGRAWFNHTWNYNDSIVIMNIDDSEPTRYRYDMIALKINRDTNERKNSFVVIKGTSSTNEPIIPKIDDTEYEFYHPLAYVKINKGSVLISDGDITNAVGLELVTDIGPDRQIAKGSPYVTGPLKILNADYYINDWRGQFVGFLNNDKTIFNNWMNVNKEDFKDWWDTVKDFFKGTEVSEAIAQLADRIYALEQKSYASEYINGIENLPEASEVYLNKVYLDISNNIAYRCVKVQNGGSAALPYISVSNVEYYNDIYKFNDDNNAGVLNKNSLYRVKSIKVGSFDSLYKYNENIEKHELINCNYIIEDLDYIKNIKNLSIGEYFYPRSIDSDSPIYEFLYQRTSVDTYAWIENFPNIYKEIREKDREISEMIPGVLYVSLTEA